MFMNSLLSFEDFAAAFSLDYECVFFVDVATGNYSMYAFRGGHKNLELTETSDFWADTKVNLEAIVFKEDKKGFAEVVNKDFLLKAVQHDSVFKFKSFRNNAVSHQRTVTGCITLNCTGT